MARVEARFAALLDAAPAPGAPVAGGA